MPEAQPTVTFLQQSEEFLSQCQRFYKPLDASRQEIRIFHILPGQWDDRIEIELEVVSLHDGPEYEAISYTWEDMTRTKNVLLEGVSYNITHNQEKLLRRFRGTSKRRTLWMDVISINQADKAEKSQQVSMMGEIYGSATTSCIWLGEPEDDWIIEPSEESKMTYMSGALDDSRGHSNEVDPPREVVAKEMRFLPRVTSRLDNISNSLILIRELAEDRHFKGLSCWDKGTDGVEVFLSPSWKSAIMTLANVLQRPWWTRVWVIQETVLPQSWPTVHAGVYEISFEHLVNASKRWKVHKNGCCSGDLFMFDEVLNELSAAMIDIESLGKLRDAYQMYPVQLRSALNLASRRHATDPRDFVYGVLSMAQEAEAKIPVDYTFSVGKVYAWASFAVFQILKSLGLLTLGKGIQKVNEIGHPSWAQDWSISSTARRTICHAHLSSERRPIALPSWKDIRFYPDALMLAVPAAQLGSIRSVCSNLPEDSSIKKKDDRQGRRLLHWWSFLENEGVDIDESRFLELLFRFKELNVPFLKGADDEKLLEFMCCITEDFRYCVCSSMVLHMELNDFLDDTFNGLIPFVTDAGDPGLGFAGVQPGDELFGIFGSPPLALRPATIDPQDIPYDEAGRNAYRLVGACKVTGKAAEALWKPEYDAHVLIL